MNYNLKVILLKLYHLGPGILVPKILIRIVLKKIL
jgi:hypothetical protein